MADVYASAVGTTVLQLKEIPPRPKAFDGRLCLFGLKSGVNEEAIRDAFGEVASCCLGDDPPTLLFPSHEAALRAKEVSHWSELCEGVDMLYNERSYDGRHSGDGGRSDDNGRGWCCFESAVSSELLERLRVFPKLRVVLDTLPPKVLTLGERTPELSETQPVELEQRVEDVVARISRATFTGKGDSNTVPLLYKEYVERITSVVQRTLAYAATDVPSEQLLPPKPIVTVPDAAPLRLADGQLLLVLRSGPDGGWQLGEVEGQSVRFGWLLASGEVPLSFDRCSQAVLPWEPPTSGWDEGLRQEIAKLQKKKNNKQQQDRATQALRTMGVAGLRRYAGGQLLTARSGGSWRDAEVIAADESAPADHRLRLDRVGDVAIRLHPWNHAPRELPQPTFEELRRWWVQALQAQHSHLTDAMLGRRLDVLEQCVAIDVSGDNKELAHVKDAALLTSWLHSLHEQRLDGAAADTPSAALLTGRPAAGKTSLLSQVIVHSLAHNDTELLPVLIKVQLLQSRLLAPQTRSTFAAAWNWVDAYLQVEHGESFPALYCMLRQAMMARRVLLLLDGLDEGGEKRDEIERHVVEVLAMQGLTILATSRPDGIDGARFARFHRLQLSPLTDKQQQQALEQRFGMERASVLIPFLSERVPTDGETGQKITSNPLMLSMVASIFELRQGLEMPSTVVELYKVAIDAMLARAGESSSAADRALLQAVFFNVHCRKSRAITLKDLQAAAQELPDGEAALSSLLNRVKQDRMPLLSLLQLSPLKVQAAHLSFQEYFAARSVCEGMALPTPPWELEAWWSNMVRLGREMGDDFGRGLLKAKSVPGLNADQERLEVTFIGNTRFRSAPGAGPSAVASIVAAVPSLRELQLGNKGNLDMRGSNTSGDAAELLAAAVLANKSITVFSAVPIKKLRAGKMKELTLAEENIGDAGAIVLAELVKVGGALTGLTNLDTRSNNISGDAAQQLAAAVLASASLRVFSAVPIQELRADKMTALRLEADNLGPAEAIVIAELIKVSGALTMLELSFNKIGPSSAMVIAEALEVNSALTKLTLGFNKIGPSGATSIAEALKVNGALKLKELFVDDRLLNQQALNAACAEKGVRLR